MKNIIFKHNNFTKKSGLTLTELLVASILVGIVMVTVAGFTSNIKWMQESTSKDTILSLHSTAVLTHITKNAGLATGHRGNPGVVVENATPNLNNWISVRIDTLSTPTNFSDDIWVIYVRDLVNFRLYTCRQTALQGSTPLANCTNTAANPLAKELSRRIRDVQFSIVTNSATNVQNFYVQILLDIIYTPGSAVDAFNNPVHQVTTFVTPEAHSW